MRAFSDQANLTALLNSEGMCIASTAEGIEAFRHWFGNSAIIDPASKQPLRVYHGTRPGNDIEEFRIESHGQDGIYFTPSPAYAEGFTRDLFGLHEGECGAMYPVYLSIKNPFVVCADESSEEWERFVYHGHSRLDLLKQGYDGAMLVHKPSGEIDQVMAFFPHQVKSALGNPGSYDPNSSHITDGHKGPMDLASSPPAPAAEDNVVDVSGDLDEPRPLRLRTR